MSEGYSEPVGEAWKYNQDYHRLSEFLGVSKYDRENYDTAKKVSLIRDWAGLQGKDDSTESALKAIQDWKRKAGIPYQGRELIHELVQHIRLDMDRKSRAHINPTTPIKSTQPVKKTEKAPAVTKMVQGAVQQSIQGMVKNVLKDKKVLSNAIQAAVKESLQ